MKTKYNVLWSGGWDSTFRVIQLYRCGAIIQPIYVDDHNRTSKTNELEVIKRLSTEIPERFNTSNGSIKPIKIIKRNDIPFRLIIKIAHKVLRHRMQLGKQYYWLAYLAQKYNDLELSLHKEDMDRFFYLHQLERFKDDAGDNWRINSKKITFHKRQIFSKMCFPLIAISKPEMKNIAIEQGFIDLLETTWFCHKSTKKPCGKCTPCKQYVRDGFGYRLKQNKLDI